VQSLIAGLTFVAMTPPLAVIYASVASNRASPLAVAGRHPLSVALGGALASLLCLLAFELPQSAFPGRYLAQLEQRLSSILSHYDAQVRRHFLEENPDVEDRR
jgi:hypothetical protein